MAPTPLHPDLLAERDRTFTIVLHLDLRPRPWWALRWRPWRATLLHGYSYIGYPTLSWHGRTRDEVVAKVSRKIPRMAQGWGQATWKIEVDDAAVEA